MTCLKYFTIHRSSPRFENNSLPYSPPEVEPLILRMTRFTKRIETLEGDFNFYFNVLFAPEGMLYHISVVGKDKKGYSFKMKKLDEAWVLYHPSNCPEWIIRIEPQVSRAIIESGENI